MKKRYWVSAIAGAGSLIAMAGIGFAQGLPSIGGMNGAAPAGTDASASQDQLVRAYVAADVQTLLGQGKIAEALGLKDQAAEAAAEAAALQNGGTATSDTLSKANDVSTQVDSAVAAKTNENAALSDQSKAAYSEGLGHLGLGLLGTIALKDAAVNFQKAAQAQIGNASMLEKMSVTKKLAAGMYVAKNLPGHITRLGSGLKNAVAYAHSHNIPVPDDATKALGAL
jgi:hypothetical protein